MTSQVNLVPLNNVFYSARVKLLHFKLIMYLNMIAHQSYYERNKENIGHDSPLVFF